MSGRNKYDTPQMEERRRHVKRIVNQSKKLNSISSRNIVVEHNPDWFALPKSIPQPWQHMILVDVNEELHKELLRVWNKWFGYEEDKKNSR